MLRPVNTNIIIEKVEEENKSKGGLILSDTSKDKMNIGIVVGVGNKVECGLKIGDKVYTQKFVGTEIEYEEKKYTIITESEILAVVE